MVHCHCSIKSEGVSIILEFCPLKWQSSQNTGKNSIVNTFNSIENDECATKVKKLAAITIHNCSQKWIKQRIAGGGVQWRVTSDDGRGWWPSGECGCCSPGDTRSHLHYHGPKTTSKLSIHTGVIYRKGRYVFKITTPWTSLLTTGCLMDEDRLSCYIELSS